MRSKTMSEIIVVIKPSTLDIVLTTFPQMNCVGTEAKQSNG